MVYGSQICFASHACGRGCWLCGRGCWLPPAGELARPRARCPPLAKVADGRASRSRSQGVPGIPPGRPRADTVVPAAHGRELRYVERLPERATSSSREARVSATCISGTTPACLTRCVSLNRHPVWPRIRGERQLLTLGSSCWWCLPWCAGWASGSSCEPTMRTCRVSRTRAMVTFALALTPRVCAP